MSDEFGGSPRQEVVPPKLRGSGEGASRDGSVVSGPRPPEAPPSARRFQAQSRSTAREKLWWAVTIGALLLCAFLILDALCGFFHVRLIVNPPLVLIKRWELAAVMGFTIILVVLVARRLMREAAERKRTTQALRLSEERYHSLVENMDLGITLIDDEHRIIMTNSAQGRMFNKPPADFIGRHCFEEFEKRESVCPHCPGKIAVATGKPASVETAGIRDDGTAFSASVRAFPIFDPNGAVSGFVEVVEDITERARAEDILRHSEERFRALTENAGDIIFLCAADRTILYLSPSVERILGFKPEELVGKTANEFIHPEDRPTATTAWQEAVSSERKEPTKAEVRFRHKDGSWHYLESMRTNLLDNPVVGAVVINARDVTERRRTQEALRESERKHKALLENLPHKIFHKDRNSVYVSCNENYARDLKIKAEEIAGKTDYDFHPKELADKYRADDARVMADGHVQVIEEEYVRDGEERFIHTVKTPVRDDAGVVVGVMGIFYDITERKNAENTLRRNEERFRSLVENATDTITVFDADRIIAYQSPSVERMLGFHAYEMVGKKTLEFIHPDDVEAIRAKIFDKDNRHPGVTRQAQIRLRHKNGSWRLVESRATDLLDDPAVRGIVCNCRDVTDHMQAEERLRESEKRHRTLLETLPQRITYKDGNLVYVLCNEHYAHSLNMRVADIVGKTSYDLFPKELAERYRAQDKEVMDSGRSQTFEDSSILDGQEVFFHTVKTPVRNEKGDVVGVLGIFFDMTERRQMEEALRRSEERFRALTENALDTIAVFAADGTIMYESPSVERLLGYPAEEMKGRSSLDLIHPDDAERVNKYLWGRDRLPPGIIGQIQFRIRHKDGSWRVLEVVYTNLLDNPSVKGIVANSRDVTERVKAEAELTTYREHLEEMVDKRTSELENANQLLRQEIAERERAEQALIAAKSRLQYLLMSSPAMVYTVEMEDDYRTTFASENSRSLLGHDPQDFLCDPAFWLNHVHPDDRQRFLDDLQDLSPGQDCIREYRFQRKDGGYIWVRDECIMTHDASGEQPREILGCLINITRRVHVQEEMTLLNETLERETRQLEFVNKELEAFAYSVSHDLRAPLRAIDGFSQAIIEDCAGQLDEHGHEHLQRVRSAVQRMDQLINDLLELSRLTRTEIRREEVDLAGIAKSIAAELKESDRKRNVEFCIQEPATAYGDEHLLRIALKNLLDNAWKFTSKHPRARIEFGVTDTDEGRAFFVRDDGAGFDMAYANKLFIPFQRVHATSEFPGTGIGLATIQRIVNRHGGRIWAEGAVEKGATVYFTLKHRTERRTT